MYISTNDLFYLNEVGKLIKQSDFIVFKDRVYGISALNAHVCEFIMDINKISFMCNSSMIINKMEISAFVKGLTTEQGFEAQELIIGESVIRNNIGGELHIKFDYYHNLRITEIYNQILMMNNISPVIEVENVSEKLQQLYSMKKDDGVYTYIHHDYYMTLYYGLLPLNKSDKLYLSIYTGWEIFYAKFTIQKPKYNLNVYVAYLKIPKHEDKR